MQQKLCIGGKKKGRNWESICLSKKIHRHGWWRRSFRFTASFRDNLGQHLPCPSWVPSWVFSGQSGFPPLLLLHQKTMTTTIEARCRSGSSSSGQREPCWLFWPSWGTWGGSPWPGSWRNSSTFPGARQLSCSHPPGWPCRRELPDQVHDRTHPALQDRTNMLLHLIHQFGQIWLQ